MFLGTKVRTHILMYYTAAKHEDRGIFCLRTRIEPYACFRCCFIGWRLAC